jgi:hypothetical protein
MASREAPPRAGFVVFSRMGEQSYENYKYSRNPLQIGTLGPTLIQKGMLLLSRCRSDGQFS